jgi:DNA-binding transcriptional LysR family regulator
MPGASHVMGPRAIVRRRGRHPELELYINILRIEEALDDILLGQGEVAVMGYRLSHPSIDIVLLMRGSLVCIVPRGHPLADRPSVSARDMARLPTRHRADRPLRADHVRTVRARERAV